MYGRVGVYLHSFVISALDGGKWSLSLSSHNTPSEELIWRAGWAPERVFAFWRGENSLASIWNRIAVPRSRLITLQTELSRIIASVRSVCVEPSFACGCFREMAKHFCFYLASTELALSSDVPSLLTSTIER